MNANSIFDGAKPIQVISVDILFSVPSVPHVFNGSNVFNDDHPCSNIVNVIDVFNVSLIARVVNVFNVDTFSMSPKVSMFTMFPMLQFVSLKSIVFNVVSVSFFQCSTVVDMSLFIMC